MADMQRLSMLVLALCQDNLASALLACRGPAGQKGRPAIIGADSLVP